MQFIEIFTTVGYKTDSWHNMHVNVSCRSIFPNNIINYKSSVVFIVGQNYNTKQCEMWDTMCVCVCVWISSKPKLRQWSTCVFWYTIYKLF